MQQWDGEDEEEEETVVIKKRRIRRTGSHDHLSHSHNGSYDYLAHSRNNSFDMLASHYGSHDALSDWHDKYDRHGRGKHERHDGMQLDAHFGSKTHARSKSLPVKEQSPLGADRKQQRGRFKVRTVPPKV